jgi:hypothetical protein
MVDLIRDDASVRARAMRSELWATVAVFAGLCVVALVRAPQMMEPDDYAYRASIVALSEGHVLLTNAQYFALRAQLSRHGAGGIAQWVHLKNGKWISQKNPGYPFLAVIFQWLHALRVAPLFYGALGCGGLFYGARRWLGRGGGLLTVALYCTSGAALFFAWRATMPTFTDASLIAGAAGLLLGVLLSHDDPPVRRFLLGGLAFLALDAAAFVRYTDVVELLIALVAVLALARACALTGAMLLGWIAAVVAFGVFDLEVNHLLYGGYLTTGYASGLVTFSVRAILPNLERMPPRLVASMPLSLLGLAALIWIVVRLVRRRSGGAPSHAGRDGVVALVLGVGWLAAWGLYLAYTWTVGQTIGPSNPVHVIRFYVPALGLSALLGAWLLLRLPRWVAPVLLVLITALGLWYFVAPSNDVIVHALPSGQPARQPVYSPGPPPGSPPSG